MPVTHEPWLVALTVVVAIQGAYVGLRMGMGFAFQWIVSIYQMWFYKYSLADHPKASVG